MKSGGYLWSPKRNANGARNPFYESMREVAPGDLIFSFMDTRILAVGIAKSYCWESPKPLEFGKSGQNWEGIGWRVRVQFAELTNKVCSDALRDGCSVSQRHCNRGALFLLCDRERKLVLIAEHCNRMFASRNCVEQRD